MHSFCVFENHTKEVNCCAFSDDYFVTCSGDKTIRVYSASTFKELPYSPIKVFTYGVNYVTFNKSGQYLASACNDGKAHLFQLTDDNVKTVAIFRHSDSATAQVCSFSHNSNYLVTGSADGSIALWDINKKKLIREISGHPEGNVYAATFTPCSCYLVTGSGLGDIRVWDTSTMQSTMQTQAHDEGISSCGVTCITFSPTFHRSITDPIRCYLMASSGQDNKIKIWMFSNETRSLQSYQELSGHHGPVSFCCFSSDGKRLASSSFDKTIIIWDPLLREQHLVLDGHGTIVTSVAFSTNDYLASTSYDKKVIIWRMDNNEAENEHQTLQIPTANDAEEITQDLIDVSLEPLVKPQVAAEVKFESWSCDEVLSWLTEQVGLGQYSSQFSENEIDGAELTSLTSEVLQKDLGIGPLGHRNKITRAIKSLQESQGQSNTKLLPSPATFRGIQSHDWQKVQKSSVKVTDNRPAYSEDGIPDQYLCPISREIMVDPVISADGFTYERGMIEAWFAKGNKLSPMSNKILSNKKLIPNQSLKSLIGQYLDDRQMKSQQWAVHNDS